MTKFFLSLLTLLLGPALAEPLRVVATVGMIADVAQEVAGDCAEVSALMQPGVDPHLYRARPSDVRELFYADLVLYSGYGLEGQLGEVLGALGERKPVLAVTEAAVPQADTLLADDAYGVDPHLWMDVARWAELPAVIAGALAQLEPGCAEALAERASAYTAQLLALDAWVRESVASIPAAGRVLVTAHDAFGYYGAAYGLEVAAVQGLSTEAEASLADVRDTVALVVERRVPALFVESSINPRTVQAVFEAVAARGGSVCVGGELFSDALGGANSPEGSYIGMIHHNTRAIAEALGGSAPPLPEALAPWLERWQLEANEAAP